MKVNVNLNQNTEKAPEVLPFYLIWSPEGLCCRANGTEAKVRETASLAVLGHHFFKFLLSAHVLDRALKGDIPSLPESNLWQYDRKRIKEPGAVGY